MKVDIDIEQMQRVIIAAAPSRDDLARAIRGIASAALVKWKKLAKDSLRSTSRDYIQGLQLEYPTPTTAVITLNGVLPNMIESGWAGGDMRAWMLKSPRAKQGKKGPYLVVPFRHGSPGTSGRNVGPEMPTSIHAVAKKLAPTVSRPTGGKPGVKYGGRLHPGLPMTKQARETLLQKKRPWHTTGIYRDMIREQKTYVKAVQNQYTTFRTISQHSNEPGKHWVHPGLTARAFAPKVRDYAQKIASALMVEAMKDGK